MLEQIAEWAQDNTGETQESELELSYYTTGGYAEYQFYITFFADNTPPYFKDSDWEDAQVLSLDLGIGDFVHRLPRP